MNSDIIRNIYDGAIYLYTILLIITAIALLISAVKEAYSMNYWYCLLSLIGSGLSFGIVTLTSQYLVKPDEDV